MRKNSTRHAKVAHGVRAMTCRDPTTCVSMTAACAVAIGEMDVVNNR
jgi:hypothetical protein